MVGGQGSIVDDLRYDTCMRYSPVQCPLAEHHALGEQWVATTDVVEGGLGGLSALD